MAALDPLTRPAHRLRRLAGQGGPDLNDVWVLKDATGDGHPAWEPLTPEGVPPEPRSGAAGVYDPSTNRLIVFGGRRRTTRYSATRSC